MWMVVNIKPCALEKHFSAECNSVMQRDVWNSPNFSGSFFPWLKSFGHIYIYISFESPTCLALWKDNIVPLVWIHLLSQSELAIPIISLLWNISFSVVDCCLREEQLKKNCLLLNTCTEPIFISFHSCTQCICKGQRTIKIQHLIVVSLSHNCTTLYQLGNIDKNNKIHWSL